MVGAVPGKSESQIDTSHVFQNVFERILSFCFLFILPRSLVYRRAVTNNVLLYFYHSSVVIFGFIEMRKEVLTLR